MSRRRPQVALTVAVLSALGGGEEADDVEADILDAAEGLLRSAGLRRWSMDDVADRAGVGRTSVYRRFAGRDELVHAVLARELRATIARIGRAAAGAAAGGGTLEDRIVAATGAALAALDGSVVDGLLRSDPATFLPYLTTEAGPLLAIARDAITSLAAGVVDPLPPELAEAAARFGLSFVLTRDTVLPVDDPEALAVAVRRLVRPFLLAFDVPTG